jgi:pyrroline-5-carboxylate reductase
MENFKLGFIGGGRIVQALLDGLQEANYLEKLDISISCPSADDDKSSLKRFKNTIHTTTSNTILCNNCDIIFLAVKAKLIKSICNDIRKTIDENRLSKIFFISIVPGLTISTLTQWFSTEQNILRIMYNVNVAKRNGSYAISSLQNSPSEVYLKSIFNQVAYFAGNVSETEIDIMCALIGSGPAFFCTAVEGLADGAVKAGLSRSLANTLAARTMLGCAELLVSSSKHPAELKNEISTPAGTTIYGLHELENNKQCLKN